MHFLSATSSRTSTYSSVMTNYRTGFLSLQQLQLCDRPNQNNTSLSTRRSPDLPKITCLCDTCCHGSRSCQCPHDSAVLCVIMSLNLPCCRRVSQFVYMLQRVAKRYPAPHRDKFMLLNFLSLRASTVHSESNRVMCEEFFLLCWDMWPVPQAHGIPRAKPCCTSAPCSTRTLCLALAGRVWNSTPVR